MSRRLALLALLLACACKDKPPDVDPKAEADGHYVAAQSAYLKGDFAEAHKQFAEVRRLNAADPRLAAAEGEVWLAEGKLDEALALFEEAVGKDAKRGTSWSRLASLYSLKKQPEKAAQALDKALELNPKDFNALELRADLELAKGKLDDAVALLGRAADAAPDQARSELLLRATALLDKAKRQAAALGVLEAAQTRAALPAAAANELGDRLVTAGRLPDALKAYTRAAQANPKDPTLWELVGELEFKLDHRAEAEAAYRKSLAVKDRGVVHVALARLCQAKKDSACVNAELDRAVATASGEELRETTDLADLLSSLDRKRDALTLLRTVSEEADQKNNTALQLKTARLARELKDDVTVQAACTRALSTGLAGVRCP